MARTLEQKREKLKAELAKINNKLNAEQRRADTRKKILVGAFLLGQGKDPIKDFQGFDEYLTKDSDRELFGLKPIPKKSEGGHNAG